MTDEEMKLERWQTVLADERVQEARADFTRALEVVRAADRTLWAAMQAAGATDDDYVEVKEGYVDGAIDEPSVYGETAFDGESFCGAGINVLEEMEAQADDAMYAD